MLAIMQLNLFIYLFILIILFTASSKKKLSPLDLATSATASAVVVDDVKTQTSPNIDSKSHLGNHSGKEHVNMHISPPLSTGDEGMYLHSDILEKNSCRITYS